MQVGEIWIEKDYEEDETPDVIRLLEYNGNDIWTVVFGELEDGLFVEDDDDDSTPFICNVSGDIIYTNYIKYSEAFV